VDQKAANRLGRLTNKGKKKHVGLTDEKKFRIRRFGVWKKR